MGAPLRLRHDSATTARVDRRAVVDLRLCHTRPVWDIRAVITDLDGTVVDEDKYVSPATVHAATGLAARGTPLIIATARTPNWVTALEPLISSVRVAVCCGGAVGWSPTTREVLWRDTIPTQDIDRIIRFTEHHLRDGAIAAYDGAQWRVTAAFATMGPSRPGLVETIAAARITEHPVCALSICHLGGQKEQLSALISELGLTMDSAAGDVVDIAPHGTDKATGVHRALAGLGLEPAQAIAFGDMPIDLPMFALCGYSVAVANAHPDVVAAATIVARCVHDDGFTRALADLGLIGAFRGERARNRPDCACPRFAREILDRQ
jgi:Cof subfamily protein (haloacid dehalogenase superfamily)